jgi:D-amino-acid dehydrogenase
VVIGGGVIGAGCAHFLNRASWQVTVLDKGAFGQGCSHANCGFVCPSHVLPLCVPGAIGPALKAMFTPNSPLRIKPRFDLSLWSWLYRFARRCNERDMMEAGRAIQALLNSSRSLYETLITEERLDCEWEARGLLFVFGEHAALDHHGHTAELLKTSFGLTSERYDDTALNELEPAIKPGLAGGWLYPCDAHLRPDKLMVSWRQALEKRGVIVRENCELQGFAGDGGKARAALTNQGEVPADAFVVATGAWTPLLARHLGCKVPIQPGKGYSITMARPACCPSHPLVFEERRVAVTPMQSAYRLGSTMEFAGYDPSLSRARLDLLRNGARPFLREPFGEPVQEEWYGWRPMTYDGKPIIDRSPVLANVLIAAGHNMLGLSMAPATGKLVAELLSGEKPHIDPGQYAVSRF